MVNKIGPMVWRWSEVLVSIFTEVECYIWQAWSHLISVSGGFDRELWQKLKRDMDYTEQAPPPVEEVETESLSINPVVTDVVRYIVIVALVIALVYVVLRLFGAVGMGKRKRKQPPSESGPQAPDDLSRPGSVAELEKALEAARNRGDRREVIRLLYRMALLRLGEQKWLRLLPEKTNWEYVEELEDQSWQSEFGRLTRAYEYIWYGGSGAAASSFDYWEAELLRFNAKIVEQA